MYHDADLKKQNLFSKAITLHFELHTNIPWDVVGVAADIMKHILMLL